MYNVVALKVSVVGGKRLFCSLKIGEWYSLTGFLLLKDLKIITEIQFWLNAIWSGRYALQGYFLSEGSLWFFCF